MVENTNKGLSPLMRVVKSKEQPSQQPTSAPVPAVDDLDKEYEDMIAVIRGEKAAEPAQTLTEGVDYGEVTEDWTPEKAREMATLQQKLNAQRKVEQGIENVRRTIGTSSRDPLVGSNMQIQKLQQSLDPLTPEEMKQLTTLKAERDKQVLKVLPAYKEELEKSLKENYDRLNKGGLNSQVSVSPMGATITPPKSDHQTQAIKIAIDYTNKAIDLAGVDPNDWVAAIGKGFANQDYIDLVSFGMKSLGQNYAIAEISKKAMEGTATQDELAALDMYETFQSIASTKDTPITYDIVGSFIQSLPYMAEIAIGAGATAPLRSVVAKWAGKNMMRTQLGRNMPTLIKGASKGLAFAAGTIPQTALSPSTFKGASEVIKDNFHVGRDMNGGLTVSKATDQQNHLQAYLRGWGDFAISVMAESSGELFGLGGKAIGKWLGMNKGNAKVMTRLSESMQALSKNVLFHGIAPEMIEEYTEMFLQTLLMPQRDAERRELEARGIGKWGALLENFTDARQFWTTFGSVAMTSGIFRAGSIPNDIAIARQRSKAVQYLNGVPEALRVQVSEAMGIEDVHKRAEALSKVDLSKADDKTLFNVLNYVMAKNHYDVMKGAKLGETELSELEKARGGIIALTNKKTGQVHTAKLASGDEVYVINGSPYDKKNTVTTFNLKTGEKKMLGAELLNEVKSADQEALMQQAAQEVLTFTQQQEATMEAEEISEASGIPAPVEGDEITLPDGKTLKVNSVQGDKVLVDVVGDELGEQVIDLKEWLQMQAEQKAQQQPQAQAQAQQQQQQQQQTPNELPPPPANLVHGEDGKLIPFNPTQQQGQQQAQAQQPQVEIPRLEDGSPDYDSMTPEQFASEYVNEFGREDAIADIQGMIEANQQAIEKINAKGAKTTNERAQSKREAQRHAKDIERLEKALNIIGGVAQEQAPQVDNSAQNEANINQQSQAPAQQEQQQQQQQQEQQQQQQQQESDPHAIINREIEALKAKRNVMPKRQYDRAMKRLERQKKIIGRTLKARGKVISKAMEQALRLDVGSDMRGMVLQHFIGGAKINQEVINELFSGSMTERNKRISLLSKLGKNIDELAHEIWEDDPYTSDTRTTREFRNIIEEVINSFHSPTAMAKHLLEVYQGSTLESEMDTEAQRYAEEAEAMALDEMEMEEQAFIEIMRAAEINGQIPSTEEYISLFLPENNQQYDTASEQGGASQGANESHTGDPDGHGANPIGGVDTDEGQNQDAERPAGAGANQAAGDSQDSGRGESQQQGQNPVTFQKGDTVESIYNGEQYVVENPENSHGIASLRNTRTGKVEQFNAHNNAHFVVIKPAPKQAEQGELFGNSEQSKPEAVTKPSDQTLEEFSEAVYSGAQDFTLIGNDKESIQSLVENYHATTDPQNKQLSKEAIDAAIKQHHEGYVFDMVKRGESVPDRVLEQYPELKRITQEAGNKDNQQSQSAAPKEASDEDMEVFNRVKDYEFKDKYGHYSKITARKNPSGTGVYLTIYDKKGNKLSREMWMSVAEFVANIHSLEFEIVENKQQEDKQEESAPTYTKGTKVSTKKTPAGWEHRVKYNTTYGSTYTAVFYTNSESSTFPSSFKNDNEIDAYKDKLRSQDEAEQPDPNDVMAQAKRKQQEKQQPKPKPTGLVSDERYEELKRRMRNKLGGQLNAGFDPEVLAIGAEMAMYHVSKGAVKFAEFSKRMMQELGEAIKPYLKAIYNAAKDMPGMEILADQMDDSDTVRRFNLDSLNAPKEEVAPEQTPKAKLVASIKEKFKRGEAIANTPALTKLADEAGLVFGKDYRDIKELYDMAGSALNHLVQEQGERFNPNGKSAQQAKEVVAELIKLESLLPTETQRSKEQVDKQQYSTPLAFAYIVNWAAQVNEQDTALEPSAGEGNIAIFAQNSGARVLANEIDGNRRNLLSSLGFDLVMGEDAKHIHAVRAAQGEDVTVVVMNPPFSRDIALGGSLDIHAAEKHMDAALAKLKQGGRLVAIVGRGMSLDSPTHKEWWLKIASKYNIRANVLVSGDAYSKKGTSFDNRILVIDKTDPEVFAQPIGGKAESYGDLLTLLQQLPAKQRIISNPKDTNDGRGNKSDTRGGSGAADQALQDTEGQNTPIDTDQISDGGVRGGGLPGRPDNDGTRPNNNAPHGSGQGAGGLHGGRNGAGGRGGAGSGNTKNGKTGEGKQDTHSPVGGASERGSVERHDEQITVTYKPRDTNNSKELSYDEYTPEIQVEGSKPHPSKLVESTAMASVNLPETHYTPNLPKEIITEGRLSDAQLEDVILAGNSHTQTLANGERRGFFLGAGTGYGKGRTLAAIIADNFNQGRKKAVWISKNDKAHYDSPDYWQAVGGDPKALRTANKTKASKPIAGDEGVMLTTYDTLKQRFDNRTEYNEAYWTEEPTSRLQQLVQWLGKDFDGVIVFDEAHEMGNVTPKKTGRGFSKPAQKALAGSELQKLLPKARIVYSSATGATEVSNLAYGQRLGLWGDGTPFARVGDFVSAIEKSGVEGMEIIAKDLKSMGLYTSKSISYDGVQYEQLTHELSPEQKELYNSVAKAWQIVLQNINEATEANKTDRNSKASAMSAFWGAQQRFFSQIITTMQMPSLVKDIQKNLDEGRSIVIQLVSTNEAQTNKALTEAKAEASESNTELDLEALDVSPKESLLDYLRKSFPVQQFQEVRDEDGNKTTVPVFDSEGQPVLNPEAVAKREKLLQWINETIVLPEAPLDIIINTFGADNVAEVTGRSTRIVNVTDEEGNTSKTEQKRTPAHAKVDKDAFMDGDKRILVFSKAGGTGASFHADKTRKNTQQRVHYVLQTGWKADDAVQGFGRSHRSNQDSAPIFKLVSTNIKAQKRFLSSIARRLDQLGALTKGQRQSGGQGIVSGNENYEGYYAKQAIFQMYRAIESGMVPGLSLKTLQDDMGLKIYKTNADGTKEYNEDVVNNPKMFLNRILSLDIDTMDLVFDAFIEQMDKTIAKAKDDGSFNEGIEMVKAVGVDVVDEQEIYVDPKTGAKTTITTLEVELENHKKSWGDIQWFAGVFKERFAGYFREKQSGKVYAMVEYDGIDAEGKSRKRYKRHSVVAETFIEESEMEKYEQVNDKNEARQAWEQQHEEYPATRKRTDYIVKGLLLPIWDKLPGEVNVKRYTDRTGRAHLGRYFSKNHMDNIRKTFDVLNSVGWTMELVMDTLESGGRVRMANGIALTPMKYQGQDVLRVDNQKYGDMDRLERAGATFRVTNSLTGQGNFVIPMGTASNVIENMLDLFGTNFISLTDKGGNDVTPDIKKQGAKDNNRDAANANRTYEQMEKQPVAEYLEQRHTTMGTVRHTVKLTRKLEKDYSTVRWIAEDMGGKWNHFGKDGAVPAFEFKSKEDAESFAERVNGMDKSGILAEPKPLYNEKATRYKTKEGKEIQYTLGSDLSNADNGAVHDSASPSVLQRQGRDTKNPLLRKLKKGEVAIVERTYSESGQFVLTGKERIESAEDVAFIFRGLETAAVEQTFLVLVDGQGKPTILHTGMGNQSASVVDTSVLNDAIPRFKPKRLFVLHNHPSGNLVASDADNRIIERVRKMVGGVPVTGIIINTNSGKFLEIDEWDNSHKSDRVNQPEEARHKVLAFDRQVFRQDQVFGQIRSSRDVASIVSGLRYANGAKMGVLVLTSANTVNAVMYTSRDLMESERLASEVSQYVARFSGTGVILFGRGMEGMDAKTLGKIRNQLDAKGVRLVDVVHVKGEVNTTGYQIESAGDLGLMEQQAEYRLNNQEQSYEGLTPAQKQQVANRVKSIDKAIADKKNEVSEAKRKLEAKKNEVSGRLHTQGTLFDAPTSKPTVTVGSLFDVPMDASQGNIDRILDPLKGNLQKLAREFTDLINQREEIVTKEINAIRAQKTIMFAKGKPLHANSERAIGAIKMERGTPDQWKAELLKNGSKQGELNWMEWDTFANGKKTITKAEVQEWIESNKVVLEEVVKSDAAGVAFDGWTDEQVREHLVDGMGADPNEVEGMSRAQMMEWANRNADMDYVEKGDAKHSGYTTPGGTNYKEVLLTLPVKPRELYMAVIKKGRNANGETYEYYEVVKINNPSEKASYDTFDTIDKANEKAKSLNANNTRQVYDNNKTFKSYHWDEPNVVLHTRFSEFTDKDGKRVLHVDEIQSDWQQEGRKKGFKGNYREKSLVEPRFDGKYWYLHEKETGEMTSSQSFNSKEEAWKSIEITMKLMDNGVAPMPFTQTDQIIGLAFKRILHHAAENGFDRVTWTTGEQQVERYSLAKQVDSIVYTLKEGIVRIYPKADPTPIAKKFSSESELADIVGKEMAQRIYAGEGTKTRNGDNKELRGLDLKVGGEGMKAFYDSIIPLWLNKFGKKFGAKVGTTQIDTKPHIEETHGIDQQTGEVGKIAKDKWLTVHSMDVTPAMAAVALGGFPMFAKGIATGRKAQGIHQAINDLNDIVQEKHQAVLVETQQDLVEVMRSNGVNPETIKEAQAATDEGVPIYGIYDHATGKVFMVVENLESVEHARRIWLHEVAGHAGIMALVPNRAERSALLSKVWESVGEKEFNRLLAEMGIDPEQYAERSKEDKANEYLANLASKIIRNESLTPKQQGVWEYFKHLINALVQKVLRLSGKECTFTSRELALIVHASLDAVKRYDNRNQLQRMAEPAANSPKVDKGNQGVNHPAGEVQGAPKDTHHQQGGATNRMGGERGVEQVRMEQHTQNKRDIRDRARKAISLATPKSQLKTLTFQHGTSAAFEQFSLNYVGMGTGEKIHGYGLYFTVNAPDTKVAEVYANKTAFGKTFTKQYVGTPQFIDLAERVAKEQPDLIKAFEKVMYKTLKDRSKENVLRTLTETKDDKAQRLATYLKGQQWPSDRIIYQGTLVKPDGKPFNFINLDEAFSIREDWNAMLNLVASNGFDTNEFIVNVGMSAWRMNEEGVSRTHYPTGMDIYNGLVATVGSPEVASMMLQRHGYDGNIYRDTEVKDGVSRENVVLFSDESVNVGDRVMFAKGKKKQQIVGELFGQGKLDNLDATSLNRLEEGRAAVQDRMLTVKKLYDHIKQNGGYIPENGDVYRQENLASSRGKHAMDRFEQEQLEPLIKAFADLMLTKGATHEEMVDYMNAKHTPERNEHFKNMGKRGERFAGELSTQEAEAAVLAFEDGLPQGVIDTFWEKVNEATDYSLQAWYRYGMMSKETLDSIKARGWQFYIPLRGHEHDDVIDDLFEYSKASGTGFVDNHRAEGRESKSYDPLAYIVNMAHSAIVAGEKNLVKQAAIRLVNANKTMKDVFVIKKVYYVEVGQHADGKPMYEEVLDKPDKQLWDDGKVKTKVERGHTKKRSATQAQEHEVTARIAGDTYVAIFADNHVANAINYNNQWAPDFSRWLQRGIGRVNRWLSANFTSKNPSFIPINFMRDMLFAGTYHMVSKEGDVAKFVKAVTVASGAIHRHLKGKPDMRHKTDQLYQEFLKHGGQTGYVHIEDLSDVRKDFIKRVNRLKGATGFARTRVVADMLRISGQWLERKATYSENLSRFATFIASVESGRTYAQAAFDAKNVTVNFNRKGRATGALNSLFAFFNASVQGGNTFLTLANKNKGRFAAVGAGYMVWGFLTAMLHDLGDDDEDKQYFELSPYIRHNYFTIHLKDGKHLSLPLPHGFRSFYALGESLYTAMSKRIDRGEFTRGVLESAFNSVSPIDVTDFIDEDGQPQYRPIIPTVMIPVYDILTNRDFAGRRIANDPFTDGLKARMAESSKHTRSVNPILKDITDGLFEAGGGDPTAKRKLIYKDGERQNIAWYYDWNPSKAEHVLTYYTGGRGKFWNDLITTTASVVEHKGDITKVDANTIPIANRLIRQSWGGEYSKEYNHFKREIADYKDLRSAARKGGSIDLKMDVLTDMEARRMTKVLDVYDKRINYIYKKVGVEGSQESLQDILDQANKLKKEAVKELRAIKHGK